MFVLGAALCAWWGPGWLSDMRWTFRDAALGLLAALPPLVLFFCTWRSDLRFFREIRSYLEREAIPWFRKMHTGHLLVIAALAGLGEEFLFRGAVQGGLGLLVGEIPALILASLIFGLCHPMTWGYLILTAAIGLYLGIWWLGTGNLLVPVIAHGLYDFIALSWLVRHGATGTGND